MSELADMHVASLLGTTLSPSGGSIVVAEWTALPISEREFQAPFHLHRDDDEIWNMLEGALGFSFDGGEFEIPEGGAAHARAGVTHSYWNASSGETRYLLIMSIRINDLISTLHDPEKRGDRSLAQVFLDNASELVGS